MDNRFGFKDFVLLVLLAGLCVSVWLAIKQADRQWEVLKSMETTVRQQTHELSQLRRDLRTGVGIATTRTAAAPAAEAFKYVRAAQEQEDYSTGDWIVDNFGVRVSQLTPLLSSDVYATVMQNRVMESLGIRDPNTLDYVPLLAASWKVADQSDAFNAYVAAQDAKGVKRAEAVKSADCPDAVVITFQLRPGVTFSDGQPMTAEDVKFTYDWIMNPAVAAPRDRAYVSKITSVKALGPLEVEMRFREPYFEALPLAMSLQVMPKHFYSQFTPKQFNEATGLLMGTGPYRMVDPRAWTPGKRLELVRNERYWGEPGPFDKLMWYEVEQDSAALTMFKNGEVDEFGATPEQYRTLLKDQQLLARTHHFEYLSPTSGYTYVAWNQRRGGKPSRFADKRVRQAMTMLIDRQRMVDEVMLGYASVATGPFSRTSKQRDPSITPWPYDATRATALLREAGFQDRDGDGVIESADGTPFRFKLTYGAKNTMSEKIALFLKDTLARAGIVMEPEPTDWAIMLKKLETRDFDAITLGWTGGIETDIYQMFHSDQIKDNGDNFMSYSNAELDQAIVQARSTVDEAKRIPIWRKAHRILHEDQAYTFLFDRKSLVFIDNRIHNVHRSKIGLNYVQREVCPIPWYVPRPLQKWSK